MSPAGIDPFERTLRAATRDGEAGWKVRDLARLERRVMRRIGAGGSPRVAMPPWMPAGAVAAAAAILSFLVMRGPVPGTAEPTDGDPGAVPAVATLSGADRAALGLAPEQAPRRVHLAGFESWTAATGLRFTGEARPELVPGGFTGRMSLSAQPGEGGLEVAIPAAHRRAVLGVEVRFTSGDRDAVVRAQAGCEDGRELELSATLSTADGRGWRRALFAVPRDEARDGGGVRWLRFQVAGRAPVRLDTMELWTTASESWR